MTEMNLKILARGERSQSATALPFECRDISDHGLRNVSTNVLFSVCYHVLTEVNIPPVPTAFMLNASLTRYGLRARPH